MENLQIKSIWSWSGLLRFRPYQWYVQFNCGNVQCQSDNFDTKKEAEEEFERLKREHAR